VVNAILTQLGTLGVAGLGVLLLVFLAPLFAFPKVWPSWWRVWWKLRKVMCALIVLVVVTVFIGKMSS
jgi:hypothetical protein